MIEERIRKKILGLISRSKSLNDDDIGTMRAWLIEALHTIELAVPLPNNAYRRETEKVIGNANMATGLRVDTVRGVLQAIVSDVDDGLIGSLRNKITSEVFDDFLDHAEFYRSKERKSEAGVIAGVVFEDTIRRVFREKTGEADKGRKLEDVINLLASQDVITAQQSKQAKVAAHVRTKATHAQWGEFDLSGVEDTIKITRQLLADHLGG
jgi:hypothetical protein